MLIRLTDMTDNPLWMVVEEVESIAVLVADEKDLTVVGSHIIMKSGGFLHPKQQPDEIAQMIVDAGTGSGSSDDLGDSEIGVYTAK
jgi:hypothetical protein